MSTHANSLLATLVVLITGSFWGGYWLPVRAISDLGVPGAWGTLGIVLAATLLLAPLAARGRHRLAASSPVALVSIALGGVAFVLYSVGFLYGRVAIVVILFFLTPVWSTLIGRLLLGWPITRMRLAALVTGVCGLLVMLGAQGEIPLPRGLGEWFGLASGLLWAISTTGIRTRVTTRPGETAFVFAAGATLGAAVMAPLLAPLPIGLLDTLSTGDMARLLAAILVSGSLWWGLSMIALLWAAGQLEPARVGILLMAEVLIGAISAAVLAGEALSRLELVGGALVLAAGVLEVWPETPRPRR